MLKIHILTAGFQSPNGCAFLYPLIVHKQALLQSGFEVGFFSSVSPALTDCDILILDSKYYTSCWQNHTERVLAEIAGFRETGVKIIYADISDSSGWVHVRMSGLIDLYLKNQLLKDRSRYKTPFYSYRCFADYYHRAVGIDDAAAEHSEPATDGQFLDKLTVGWNSGLADYSIHGPRLAMIYNKLPLGALLRYPGAMAAPAYKADRSLACRFGTKYGRATVAYQRKMIAELLSSRIPTVKKLKRKQYFQEMARSQLVMSPFGLGEITLKDFECFLVGSALFKPDMSHMETWPDFFADGETMFSFPWDLDGLEERLESILSQPERCLEVARRGQEMYLSHTSGPEASEHFVTHFTGIMSKARNSE